MDPVGPTANYFTNDTQPSMSEEAAIEAHALPNLHVVGGLGGGS